MPTDLIDIQALVDEGVTVVGAICESTGEVKFDADDCELTRVCRGLQPLAAISKKKIHPDYLTIIQNHRNKLYLVEDDRDIIFTLPENQHLVSTYQLLTSSKAVIIVRSKQEQQMMLGRLFGYSDHQIEGFIRSEMLKPYGGQCKCHQCHVDVDELKEYKPLFVLPYYSSLAEDFEDNGNCCEPSGHKTYCSGLTCGNCKYHNG